MSFKATFSPPPSFVATFDGGEENRATFSPYILVPVVDYYDGDYTIVPSAAVQTIPVMGKTGRQNITVGAIPSDYGKITWNGSTLTVS